MEMIVASKHGGLVTHIMGKLNHGMPIEEVEAYILKDFPEYDPTEIIYQAMSSKRYIGNKNGAKPAQQDKVRIQPKQEELKLTVLPRGGYSNQFRQYEAEDGIMLYVHNRYFSNPENGYKAELDQLRAEIDQLREFKKRFAGFEQLLDREISAIRINHGIK